MFLIAFSLIIFVSTYFTSVSYTHLRLKIKYFKPDANYIFFKAKCGLKEEMSNKGILIRDCSNYKGLNKGYYRIAVKKHCENIRLIKALEECIWQGL